FQYRCRGHHHSNSRGESLQEDDEEVRQKCLFLLNELVSRTEEANRRRLPHMEGGPVQCRLPLTKVSLALQAYSKHAPNVFQGHETAPLPNAITPFTPSSTITTSFPFHSLRHARHRTHFHCQSGAGTKLVPIPGRITPPGHGGRWTKLLLV
ncbi:hypothetical protein L9F63_015729, partial [Diploptera punctata]